VWQKVPQNASELDQITALFVTATSATQELQKCAPEPVALDDARGVGAEFRAAPVTDAKSVNSVIEKFREKYGAKDVKKYY
jgi:hypothetical protein